MSLGQRVRDLRRDVERLPKLDGLALNAACQRLAFDILHNDEAVTGFFVDFVDATDMRMIERSHCPGFPDEAFPGLFAGNTILRKELDGDLAVERSVLREINLSHTARA